MKSLKTAFAWHRPLMAVAALMVVCILVCVIGLLVDHRQVTGVDTWLKPLKFSISILVYAVTWAWLIAHLPRWRRAAHVTGTVIAVALVVEQVAIVGAAAAGITSHFNVSTGFATAVWAVMATSITVLYVCTLITTAIVFFVKLPTASVTLALRAGAVIALVGMGLAFLMTAPTPSQLADFQGVAGAHTVGLDDGGPGLPLLGWSTVGGDLRIPHFIGMHALQVLPLFAIVLGALGRRWRALASDRTRLELVVLAIGGYGAVVVFVTLQALAGQSIVRPAGVFLVTGWLLAGVVVVTTLVLLAIGWRRHPDAPAQPAVDVPVADGVGRRGQVPGENTAAAPGGAEADLDTVAVGSDSASADAAGIGGSATAAFSREASERARSVR
jgi:hypothetical protein